MDNCFVTKVRSAAIAGWWTLLILVLYGYLQYFIYLRVSANPQWVLSLMGPNFEWTYLQHIWLNFMFVMKFFFLVVFGLVVWLSLWARCLKKAKFD